MGRCSTRKIVGVIRRLALVPTIAVVLWGCSAASSGSPGGPGDDATGTATEDAGGSTRDSGAPGDKSRMDASTVDASNADAAADGKTTDAGAAGDGTTGADAKSDASSADGGGAAGVVVGTGSTIACVPLCVVVKTPSSPSAPDWGYENNASCVLPGTVTGKNQACTVGQPIPPKPSQAGVVILDSSTGVDSCVPLCIYVTTPTDPSSPDWSYENNASCVLPNTVTGDNQMCTTGQPIPPRPPQPGVVILDGTTGTSSCVPLCVHVTTPSSAAAPDWSYENNSPCILPETPTSKNQACTTSQAIPPPTPRPGILLVVSGADSSCVPLCAVVTTPTNPAVPDWSYEDNAACVLPNTPTAQGRRTCTAFGPTPTFIPPALTGPKVHEGFFTSNGKLMDAYGHPFVMRGVNNPDIYFDIGAQYLAYEALDPIAGYGTNTVRVVWDTTTLAGTPAAAVPAPASLLAEDLFRIIQLKMVPIVELQGATGLSDTASLISMADYFIRPEVKQVLLNFQDYVLINIANEWSGTNNYESAYVQAINLLRSNGINHTLVIDAPSFGQIVTSAATRNADIAAWFANAAALLQADPLHNLLFSVHMYESYPSTTPADVDQVLGFAGVGTTLPLVVGEFGWTHDGISVAYTEVMSQCQAKGIGYIGWSWFGNAASSPGQDLDMVTAWGGPLTSPWGIGIMQGANGVGSTSAKATIYP
jgi:mannan endo-1,4-beta-mannosidase